MSIIDSLKLTKFTWIGILSNVLFFMIVQTLFFIYIASKQFDTVLVEKAAILTELAKHNKSIAELINIAKTENSKRDAEIALITANRNKANMKLTIKFCLIPIGIISTILLLLIIFGRSNKKWDSDDTFNILLISFAYITEIYFYLFIVRKYEIVGDHYLIHNIFKKINNSIINNSTNTTQQPFIKPEIINVKTNTDTEMIKNTDFIDNDKIIKEYNTLFDNDIDLNELLNADKLRKIINKYTGVSV